MFTIESKKVVGVLGECIDFNVMSERGEECIVRLANCKVENKDDSSVLMDKVFIDTCTRIVEQDDVCESEEDWKKLYSVILVDGICFVGDRYYHYYALRDTKTEELMPYCQFNSIYIELSKMDRLESKDLKQWTELDQLCYVMKYVNDESKKTIINQLIERNPIIKLMEQRKEEYILLWLRKIIAAAK